MNDNGLTDRAKWLKMAVSNTALPGKLSGDRTIHEYAYGIWNVKSIGVNE
jgi:starch phosphorylase